MTTQSGFDPKQTFEKFVADMQQERDELMVQAHLMKADARDEWDKVEKQWDQFKGKANQVEREAKGAGEDVLAAAELLGQEIKAGFERIKKSMQ